MAGDVEHVSLALLDRRGAGVESDCHIWLSSGREPRLFVEEARFGRGWPGLLRWFAGTGTFGRTSRQRLLPKP